MSIFDPQLSARHELAHWLLTREFWEALIDGTGDGLVAVDRQGQLLYINPTAAEMSGLRELPRNLPLERWAQTVGLYRADRVTICPSEELPLWRAMHGETVERAQLFMRNAAVPAGRWLQITARPLRDAAGVPRGGVSIFRDITTEKLAEEALQESQLRFRELADNVQEVFWIVSSDFRRLFYVSPAYERITGATSDSFYQDPQTFVDLIHPDDRARALEVWDRQAQIEATELVYRIVRPDGQIRWLRARVFPIRQGEERSVERIAGISEDVTARHEADDALAQHIRRQMAIAELGRLAVSWVEPAELIQTVAQRVIDCLHVEWTGVSEWLGAENKLSVRILAAVHEPTAGVVQVCEVTIPVAGSIAGLALERVEPVVMVDSATEQRFDAESLRNLGVRSAVVVPVRLRDRSYGTLGAHSRTRRVFSPEEIHFLESCAHILAAALERKRSEELLRLNESRQRSVLDNMPDWLYTVDRQGLIRFINRGFPGYSESQLVGQPLVNFLPAEYHARHGQALARIFQEQETDGFVHRALDNRWWSTRYVPSRTEDHRPFALLISTDITTQKEAELRLLRNQDLLRQSLEAHERDRQLVAYEIHDGLVQDVTGGLMHLDAVDGATLPAKARAQFDLVRTLLRATIDEGRRLISGLRPPIIDELGVVAAIEYLISEKQLSGGTRIQLDAQVQFERLDPLIEGTIYRIVQECLTNIVRHSQATAATITLSQTGDRLRLVIWDNGIGFEPRRVKEKRFGLQGVRERARMLHGRAEVESTPGEGTRIEIEFPLSGLPQDPRSPATGDRTDDFVL